MYFGLKLYIMKGKPGKSIWNFIDTLKEHQIPWGEYTEEDMQIKDTLKIKDFPVVVRTDCKNIRRIYPSKQKDVANIYDAALNHEVIRKIYEFGSSVTGRCNIDSDLDIFIDEDTSDGVKIFHIQKEVGDICGWNCDIVMYSSAGERLKKTIQEEGVVIYEQSACQSTG